MAAEPNRSLLFFVAVHKDSLLPPPCDDYAALGVGGYHPVAAMRAYSDDIGESISQKNNHYSELTGWYWIWRNVTDCKHVGFCHYRRYFLLHPEHPSFFSDSKIYVPPGPETFRYLTAPTATAYAEGLLSNFDVVVPRRQRLPEALSRHYREHHFGEDWELFMRGIKELYPHYWSAAAWFDKTADIHPYNMMIASKAFVDSYMTSLFAILTWMERQRPFRTEPYQCRVPAFIAERFFTFYLHAVRCRYFEVPVALTEPNMF